MRLSRHHLLREEVATTPGCRDNSCKDQNVVTSISCRDVSFNEKRSRQEQAVATSPSLKTCRNNIEACDKACDKVCDKNRCCDENLMSLQYQSTGPVY